VRDGVPWFVGVDVCAGLNLVNPREAMRSLDADEVCEHLVSNTDTLVIKLVSAPGLYSLILRSRKPEAMAFKRWITHEVLPALDRTGRYSMTEPSRRELAQMVIEAEDARERAETERDTAWAEATELREVNQRNQPKVDYVAHCVDPREDVTLLRVFARELLVKETELRDYLVRHQRIYRRPLGKHHYEWLPYAKWQVWFEVREHPDVEHRGPNGQVPTTLYITPVGKAGVIAMDRRDPVHPQDQLQLPG